MVIFEVCAYLFEFKSKIPDSEPDAEIGHKVPFRSLRLSAKVSDTYTSIGNSIQTNMWKNLLEA
jgi:hypothetical protein